MKYCAYIVMDEANGLGGRYTLSSMHTTLSSWHVESMSLAVLGENE